MNCPVCKTPLSEAGVTQRCAKCEGAWVDSEVLVPLLEQSANTLVELDWKPNTEDHVRACPRCAADMHTVMLGTVALARCEAHGVWFDAKELADVLGQAKKFRAHTQAHGSLLTRLGQMFKK